MVDLLNIQSLKKWFVVSGYRRGGRLFGDSRYVRAVDGVDLKIAQGEAVGLIGNPYSGTSIVGLSIMRSFSITYGKILFQGETLEDKNESEMKEIRKRGIFLMFSSFRYPFRQPLIMDPGHPLKMNLLLSPKTLERIAVYDPRLLIADTSISPSHDVREGILSVMKKCKEERKASVLLITQDLGSIARTCDRIVVMYAGKIIEHTKLQSFMREPLHPYSKSWLIYETFLEFSEVRKIPVNLAEAIGTVLPRRSKGVAIDLTWPPSGCRFHTRCTYCMDICSKKEPALIDAGNEHFLACHLFERAHE